MGCGSGFRGQLRGRVGLAARTRKRTFVTPASPVSDQKAWMPRSCCWSPLPFSRISPMGRHIPDGASRECGRQHQSHWHHQHRIPGQLVDRGRPRPRSASGKPNSGHIDTISIRGWVRRTSWNAIKRWRMRMHHMSRQFAGSAAAPVGWGGVRARAHDQPDREYPDFTTARRPCGAVGSQVDMGVFTPDEPRRPRRLLFLGEHAGDKGMNPLGWLHRPASCLP